MKIDTEDRFVFFEALTVSEIRDEEEATQTKLNEWLDGAQAPVFSEETHKSYLVIEITARDKPRA